MSERANFRGRGGSRGGGHSGGGDHHGGQSSNRGGGRGGGGGYRGGGYGGGSQQQAEKPKKENILDLTKYMDKAITVKFTGGREGWCTPFSLFSLCTMRMISVYRLPALFGLVVVVECICTTHRLVYTYTSFWDCHSGRHAKRL